MTINILFHIWYTQAKTPNYHGEKHQVYQSKRESQILWEEEVRSYNETRVRDKYIISKNKTPIIGAEQSESKDDLPLVQKKNRLRNMPYTSASRDSPDADFQIIAASTSTNSSSVPRICARPSTTTIAQTKGWWGANHYGGEALINRDPAIKISRYLETLQFHGFELFKKPQVSYVPSWVREFYAAYGSWVPRNNMPVIEFKPVISVTIKGIEVEFHIEHINVVMERALHYEHLYEGLPKASSLDDFKELLAPLIFLKYQEMDQG